MTLALYWQVARRGFARYATYRAATFAGVFTNTVFGFMRAYVMVALFAVRPEVGGYSLSDALTYTFVTQGMIMVVYLWGWFEIADGVRSGAIVTDLSRPLDYQCYWLAQDLGRAAYHGIWRGIPPFVLGALVFDLTIPSNPLIWVVFIVSVFLAATVSFAMRFILNLAAFWLMDYRGVVRLMSALWTFFSGFAIPVAFFPEPLATVTRTLPFVAFVEIPVEIFLGKYDGLGMAGAVGFQIAWAVVLLAAGRWVLAAATRKVVIQGG